jgi:hypothetical protein
MTAWRDPDQRIRSFIRERHSALPEDVYQAVRLEIAGTRRRPLTVGGWGRPTPRAAQVIAASAAVLVVIIILATTSSRPNIGPGVRASASPPNASSSPALPVHRRVGFIGLPPIGAPPSLPETGVQVDIYPVHGGTLPFEGLARLYADGRLIWYEFYDGPAGHNGHSTGYLEQRLTAKGVELVRSKEDLSSKDPLRIPEWLPAGEWVDRAVRPFVPSRYAACLEEFDPNARIQDRVYPRTGAPMERSRMLGLLPSAAADLLRDKATQRPADDPHDCLILTTAEARVLDGHLYAAGLAQDEDQNRYVLQYQRAAPNPGKLITITFEPIFPDGTNSCSACG